MKGVPNPIAKELQLVVFTNHIPHLAHDVLIGVLLQPNECQRSDRSTIKRTDNQNSLWGISNPKS